MTDLLSFMGKDSFSLDAFGALDFKGILATKNTRGLDWTAPDWAGEHRRRIQAYNTLIAYRENQARLLLRVTDADSRAVRDDRREYGDAALIIETIRSALIGDKQAIAVNGAEEYDPSAEKESRSPAADGEYEQAEPATAKTAWELQERLKDWADKERFITKVIETERNAVTCGDGVYVLGWDPRSKRPKLRTFDPACYFPVITDGEDVEYQEYPRKVHLAWQLPDDPDDTSGVIRIRKITYDLQDVTPYDVPWSAEKVDRACFMTDATYRIKNDTRSLEDLTDGVFTADALGEIDNRNLGVDFIPVVHIPNTVSEADHFGQGALNKILQILDDIQATDSDLQAASALTGGPMLVLSGTTIDKEIEIGPNKAIKVGQNGRADIVSGAKGLESLGDYRDDLRHLLSVNSRVPEAVLGRVDPGKVQAGVVLSLSFGPLDTLIKEMRLVRRDKYRLLFRFVQRFFMKEAENTESGIEWDFPEIESDLLFGSFLPSDLTTTVQSVQTLYTAGLISRETAMRMLQEVGVPIEDPGNESRNIDKRDFDAAKKLLDVTNDTDVVSGYLGVNVEEKEIPAPLVAPPSNNGDDPEKKPVSKSASVPGEAEKKGP